MEKTLSAWCRLQPGDSLPFKQDCLPGVDYNQVQTCLNGKQDCTNVVYNQVDSLPFKQDCKCRLQPGRHLSI